MFMLLFAGKKVITNSFSQFNKLSRLSTNELRIAMSVYIGLVFAISLVATSTVAFDIFVKLFPPVLADDVRFDLFIPVYGTAYILSSLFSLFAGLIFSKVIGKKFDIKKHIDFIIRAPLFLILGHFATIGVFLVYLVIDFHIEWLDIIIIYAFYGLSLVLGYYYVLVRKEYAAHKSFKLSKKLP